MARVLIVGCGCRGQALARELLAAGHAVRGTTRHHTRQAAIEATGAEAFIADPDRVGTLTPALDGVTVMCLLLGSATGTPEQLEALHTTRLEMLLQRAIDTTIRGVIYQATGTIDPQVLATGAKRLQAICNQNKIPHQTLTADPNQWLPATIKAINALLATD
jgi:uncharacterized protein YbjT (DUF2867 family)